MFTSTDVSLPAPSLVQGIVVASCGDSSVAVTQSQIPNAVIQPSRMHNNSLPATVTPEAEDQKSSAAAWLGKEKKGVLPGLLRVGTYICESFVMFNVIFTVHNSLRSDQYARPRSMPVLRRLIKRVIEETSRITHRGPR